MRQHVNPFHFVREVVPPDWRAVFPHPDQPLEVDVGCGNGEYLLARAAALPDRNHVGLEIRPVLVERLQARIAADGLTNAAVVLCNANASFDALFAPGSLARVAVHFPDPWFKARHHKRRLVNPAFVDALARALAPGGLFDFMTDFAAYAEGVVAALEVHPAFENPHGPGAPAPAEPERLLSHRERAHLAKGDAVHRWAWRRR